MSAFNPYNEWLGIRYAGKLTYYHLLAVSPQDSAERIREQALAQIEKLNRLDVGGRTELRQRLIQKVRRAAECLTSEKQRAAYDRQLAKVTRARKGKKSIARKKSAAPKNVAVAVGAGVGHGDLATDVEDPSMDETNNFHADDDGEAESSPSPASDYRHGDSKTVTNELMRLRPRSSAIAPALKAARQRSNAFLASIILAAISVLGIGFLLLTQTEFGKTLVATSASGENPAKKIVKKDGANASEKRKAEGGQSDAVSSTGANSDSSATGVMSSERSTSDAANETPSVNSMNAAFLEDDIPTALSAHDLKRRGELAEKLTAAREALAQRYTIQATGILSTAREFAIAPDEKAMHARLAMLTEYVAEYWEASEDQLKEIESGSEITLSGQRIMVVEKSDSKLVLRSAGQNRSYDLKKLPVPLAIGLAESWFDESAATTKVFRGAMMAVTPGFDKAAARRLWSEAQESGEINLSDLEQVLDEDYGTLTNQP